METNECGRGWFELTGNLQFKLKEIIQRFAFESLLINYYLRNSNLFFALCLPSAFPSQKRLIGGEDAAEKYKVSVAKSLKAHFTRLKMNLNRMNGSRHRWRMNDIYWRMRECELFSFHRHVPAVATFHVSMKCSGFRFREGKLVWPHMLSIHLV